MDESSKCVFACKMVVLVECGQTEYKIHLLVECGQLAKCTSHMQICIKHLLVESGQVPFLTGTCWCLSDRLHLLVESGQVPFGDAWKVVTV